MGTLPEVPAPGLICLKQDVSLEFDTHLAKTEHSSADQFLEHLFDLFSKADKNAKCLQIRADLAQRFTAVVQGGQFQNSSDLMTYLLQLHTQHAEATPSLPPAPVKQVQDKHSASTSLGRKSRKSQPKRNVKHQVLLESHVDNGSSSGGGVENTVEAAWRERSVSSEEKDSSVVDGNESSTPFDLSVVKQEVIDEEEQARETTNKGGPQREPQPLCLSLHKPKFASNTSPLDRGNIGSYHAVKSDGVKHDPALNAKTSKAKINWRSSSEPPSQFPERQLVSHNQRLNRSEDSYPVESRNGGTVYSEAPVTLEKLQNHVEKEESNGYNYVLTSLAGDTPDNSHSNSLPPSPMQVPVKYPKSIHYILSSDEDEAQDLSYSSIPNEQPQNLTVAKPHKPAYSHTSMKGEKIKYDSNANAVAISPQIAQQDKPQYIAQSPFSVPQNLIFNDRRSVNSELLGPSQVYSVPHKPSASSQDPSAIPPPPQGILLAAPPPHLQVVNVIGPPPPLATQLYVQPSIIASQSNYHGCTTPLGTIVTSPDAAQVLPKTLSAGSDSNNEEMSPGRRKRKRMDDTTPFRDPPETSLPFNGPNKYRFYCDVCDTGFTRRYTFNRHKCKGRVEKHYCQLCDKAYLSKYKLKDHILVKHEGQTVACPDCGKKFSSRSSMEMHKKQQHEGQFSIWCKICGKGFNHTGHYYGHMNKHTNTKPFWCQQCGKRFYGSSYLHNHKQVCRGNNDLNYTCTMCDRKFKCELYLKKHMKTHETVPIIADPSVAKISGAELSEAGVGLPEEEMDDKPMMALNGDPMVSAGQAVFPNGPENSDSNSGLLVIDENMNADEGKKSQGLPSNLTKDDQMESAVMPEIKA